MLIAPFIHFADEAEPRTGVLQNAINEVSQPLITQLHITRRDSERLRHLLIAQRRLSTARRRNVQAELAGGRELIDDDYTVMGLGDGGAHDLLALAGIERRGVDAGLQPRSDYRG